MDKELLKKDRMRFVKNKASSNLAYLAIVFNVLYFVRNFFCYIERTAIGVIKEKHTTVFVCNVISVYITCKSNIYP